MSGVLESIPYPLGTSLSGTFRKDLGQVYSVSLNGVGFILSTMDQSSPFEFRSYGVHSLPPLKARIDTSSEPGEQLLEAWWPRAQHSWHEGLGQKVFDSDQSSRFRVHRARNLDMLSEEGKVTLGPRIEIFQTNYITEGSSYYGLESQLRSITSRARWWNEMRFSRFPDLVDGFNNEHRNGIGISYLSNYIILTNETTVETTLSGDFIYSGEGLIYDMDRNTSILSGGISGVVVGNYRWYVDSNDIKRQDFVTPGLAENVVSNISDFNPDRIIHVKNRILVLTTDGRIFESPPYTGTTLDASVSPFDPLFSVDSTTWIWSDYTEASSAILVSGFDNEESAIYAIQLSATDLQVAVDNTLGVPFPAWRPPKGENVYSIEAFSGNGVLIGTSKGLRVGTVQSDGSIEVSPLIVEMEYPCYVVKAVGKFGYFGWRDCVPGYSGVGRIDLGNLNYDVPWAIDRPGSDISEIIPFEGHMFFGVAYPEGNATGYIYQGITEGIKASKEYHEDGYFETGEIRFSTFETKDLRFMDWLSKEDETVDNQGTVEIAVKRDLEVGFTDKLSGYKAGEFSERFPALFTGTRFNLKVTLKRGIVTSTPELLEWRLRAEPRQTQNRFRERVPVMVYDFIERLDGVEEGREGLASSRLSLLRKWYREETEILYQGPDYYLTGEYHRMRIEDLQFQTYTPPARARGFGGICLIILREVA